MVVKVTEKERMAAIVADEKRKAEEPEPFDSPAASRVGGRKSLKAIMINPDEAPLIAEALEQMNRLQKSMAEHCSQALLDAIQIGGILYGVKNKLKHGELGPWVKANAPFEWRTGQNYMRLYHHKDEIFRNNITSIVKAYAAIKGETAPDDDPPDADDSTNTKGKIEVSGVIEKDAPKLPPVKAQGLMKEISLDAATIKSMREETFPFDDCKGAYRKFVVRYPVPKGKVKLIGEFVELAQLFLKPGGKLIFHREARSKK